jgi:ribosomal protein L40E
MSFFRPRPLEQASQICAFDCPRCGREAHFLRIQLINYLFLGGVPLIPVGTVAEYVRCGECETDMKPEEILLPLAQLRELDQPWTCAKCQAESSPRVTRCVKCAHPRPIQRLTAPIAPSPGPAIPLVARAAPSPKPKPAAPVRAPASRRSVSVSRGKRKFDY